MIGYDYSPASALIRARRKRGGVDAILTELGELAVGGLFLGQRLLEELDRLGVAQQFRVRAKAAVRRHLVMLHALRRGNERGIDHASFAILFQDFLPFLEQSFHTLALLPRAG